LKRIIIFAVVILFLSCGEFSPKYDKNSQDWSLSTRTITTQTYTAAGLLDTSFQTTYFYSRGFLIDKEKSILARHYDNNKLTDEKDFVRLRNNSAKLSNETLYKYDENGNVILEIDQVNEGLIYKIKNQYNDQNQLFQKVMVRKNGNKTLLQKPGFAYDTISYVYSYDRNGNQIDCIITDHRGLIIGTVSTRYSGKVKTYSFNINSAGDTVLESIYTHKGDIERQVIDNKENNGFDTIWFNNGKIVERVNRDYRKKTKEKIIITYNGRGDEIENITFH
jgi:hypothetical protein